MSSRGSNFGCNVYRYAVQYYVIRSMRTEASTLSPPEPCKVSIPAASKLIGERRTFLSRAGRIHGADASVSFHSAHTYWPGLERSSAIVAAQLPFTGAMFWLMWKRLSGS